MTKFEFISASGVIEEKEESIDKFDSPQKLFEWVIDSFALDRSVALNMVVFTMNGGTTLKSHNLMTISNGSVEYNRNIIGDFKEFKECCDDSYCYHVEVQRVVLEKPMPRSRLGVRGDVTEETYGEAREEGGLTRTAKLMDVRGDTRSSYTIKSNIFDPVSTTATMVQPSTNGSDFVSTVQQPMTFYPVSTAATMLQPSSVVTMQGRNKESVISGTKR